MVFEFAVSECEARVVLGVPPGATREEVARAYRAAVKRVHPDRAGGQADAFRRVTEAYRRLMAQTAPAESRARHSIRRFAAAWAVELL